MPDPAADEEPAPPPTPVEDTNIGLEGAQDFAYFRRLLDQGQVPRTQEFDAAGFFAEHHTPLPPAQCEGPVCLQAMLGVLPSLLDGTPTTMLQVGVNSAPRPQGSARPPRSLSVVVDVSASMRDAGKMDFVRAGLRSLLEGLSDEDRLALVAYNSDALVVATMGAVGGRRAALSDLIRELEPTGGTNLHNGLLLGYEQIAWELDSGRDNRVILLSDGQPTEGVVSSARIAEMSAGFNALGVGITTVGLGTSFNYALMNELALSADGQFYFVEDVEAVHHVFARELGYSKVPAAFDVELRVQVGPQYVFERGLGSPLWADDPDGGVLAVPSRFRATDGAPPLMNMPGLRQGREGALLLQMSPPGSSEEAGELEGAQVAVAELQYRDPIDGQTRTQRVEVDYPFAPWHTPDAGHFDAPDVFAVKKSLVMLNAYLALERSSDLFHQGQGPDAVALLRRVIAAVEDFNAGPMDEDMRRDAALLEQMADVIALNSQEPSARDVQIPDDPWPAN